MHKAIPRMYGTAILGCLALTAAHAEDPSQRGFYLGVLVGQSKLDNSRYIDYRSRIPYGTAAREWTDQSSNSLSATFGYWINPYFAVEASYWDFGEGTFNEHRETHSNGFSSQIRERFVGITTTAEGYAGGFVASYPWRNWRVSAKVSGLKHELTQAGTGLRTTTPRFPPGQPAVTSPLVMEDSFKNTSALYGASISYTWAGHYVVEADWRLVRHLGEQIYFDGLSVSVQGLGFQYRF